MDAPLHDDPNRLSIIDDDAQSYMDEDDVREVRLHHWLSETASAKLMQDSTLTRADSPLLGFDHHLTHGFDGDFNKPLPDLPASISRLRPQSTVSSTVPPPAAASAAWFQHRRSPSQSQNSTHSHSPAPSRRPSLARKPSLPLLAETTPLPPTSSVVHSSRLHSISSSLSLGSNRNAVYIDSEEVSSRLDEWLTSGNPEMEHSDAEELDPVEYYATSFERPQDPSALSPSSPSYAQGPPPNTPMIPYETPHASSSQIYLGKPTEPIHQDASINTPPDQEDVRATPVPHGKFVGPDLAISRSTSSSESSKGSPMFSAATFSTSPTSAGISSTSIVPPPSPPQTLASKPSLASLSMGVLSPKPSLSSIGLGYQSLVSSPNMLSPPAVTASRWSLSSSVAGDIEKDKKKGKRGTRKRLASFISKLAGSPVNKEVKENSDVPSHNTEELHTLERSLTGTSLQRNDLLPPVTIKPKPKPPSLKLGIFPNSQSMANLRSPTLSSKPSLTSLSTSFSPAKSSMSASTPTPTLPQSLVASPVSANFTPTSPVKNSFASTRLSVSTSMTTTSTNTASPLMPNTPIMNEAPITSPALKNAVSVPALSPTWEGPGLLKRDNSYGWSMNSSHLGESAPVSPTHAYEGEEDFEDASFYSRDFAVPRTDPVEEERQARLSLITDMLDRDLNTGPQHPKNDTTTPEPPMRKSLVNKPKGAVKVKVAETSSHSTRASPTHFRKSSSASRTSSPVQARRSGSGLAPAISPNASTPPPLPTKSNGFRGLAARMGISNSLSTPQSPPSPGTESKRKSFADLMTSGKRKGQKRRLVISGVGDGQAEIDALKEWCASLGEVRNMMKVKRVEGAVAQTSQGEQCGPNVWVVDFKKSSVAESVSNTCHRVYLVLNFLAGLPLAGQGRDQRSG
ncbi:hypothetical protein AN958_09832 [Leucoagaricus sp. SymC.cos]|nr:hypothetical protein AN958_09832 [Leucoagaricus sp. SymC.cos]